jgi:hypothetical protein
MSVYIKTLIEEKFKLFSDSVPDSRFFVSYQRNDRRYLIVFVCKEMKTKKYIKESDIFSCETNDQVNSVIDRSINEIKNEFNEKAAAILPPSGLCRPAQPGVK